MTQLVINVKQGEDINFPMQIKEDGNAYDLTGATIIVEAKKVNQSSKPALFTKTITETSDAEVDGRITSPITGQFDIRFLEEDTSHPINEYYLVITLDANNNKDIVSSYGCNYATYRICGQ